MLNSTAGQLRPWNGEQEAVGCSTSEDFALIIAECPCIGFFVVSRQNKVNLSMTTTHSFALLLFSENYTSKMSEFCNPPFFNGNVYFPYRVDCFRIRFPVMSVALTFTCFRDRCNKRQHGDTKKKVEITVVLRL